MQEIELFKALESLQHHHKQLQANYEQVQAEEVLSSMMMKQGVHLLTALCTAMIGSLLLLPLPLVD